jgi:predicted metalloprotease with PDZ domain
MRPLGMRVRAAVLLVGCALVGTGSTAVGEGTKGLAKRPAAERSVGEYHLRILAGSPPSVLVEADVDVRDQRLAMETGGGIDHLPNQWATFVRELRATDPTGRALALEPVGAEGWRITQSYSGRVRLTYGVDVRFATEPWPPGNEQAGIWLDGALFVITKPLFVGSTLEGPRRVSIALPEGWRLSSPWAADPTEAGAFIVPSREELMENSLVVGQQSQRVFRHGPFTITLALLGDLARDEATVGAALDGIARHLNRVFPRTPRSRFLVTLFAAPQDDGESFTTSAAFTTATRPTEANVMLWGNNLAHELFHIWIGGSIHGDEKSVFEWFDEGFTDYYADLALVQSRLIEPDVFVRKMEKVLARYAYFTVAPAFERQSLFEASRRRGTNRFGVYDGGWAAAFCIDGLIQEASGGRHALDDLMRALHERFALIDRPFSRADFVQLASELSGRDLASFFDRHIAGSEALPLEDCLARAGYEGAFQRYAGELWINPVSSPSTMQRMTQQRILGGSRP